MTVEEAWSPAGHLSPNDKSTSQTPRTWYLTMKPPRSECGKSLDLPQGSTTNSVGDEIKKHFRDGQHAALRGCDRMIWIAPADRHREAWYAGYDSVPEEQRKTAPLTGPIDNAILRQLQKVTGGNSMD